NWTRSVGVWGKNPLYGHWRLMAGTSWDAANSSTEDPVSRAKSSRLMAALWMGLVKDMPRNWARAGWMEAMRWSRADLAGGGIMGPGPESPPDSHPARIRKSAPLIKRERCPVRMPNLSRGRTRLARVT